MKTIFALLICASLTQAGVIRHEAKDITHAAKTVAHDVRHLAKHLYKRIF